MVITLVLALCPTSLYSVFDVPEKISYRRYSEAVMTNMKLTGVDCLNLSRTEKLDSVTDPLLSWEIKVLI